MLKLDRKNVEDIMNLTALQQGMLYYYLKNPESEQYFEKCFITLKGNLDLKVFKETWTYIQKNNELLRTVYRWNKLSTPVQVVLRSKKLEIKQFDLSMYENYNVELSNIKNTIRNQKIDIRINPMEVSIIKVKDDEYILGLVYHHILFDGWSNGIVLREFFDIYNKLLLGKNIDLSKKKSYKEFIKYERNIINKKNLNYWRNKYSNLKINALINTDFIKNNNIKSANRYIKVLESKLVDKLNRFCRKYQLTLSTLIYCAWGIVVSKNTGNENVCFGITVSGRTDEIDDIENIVGLFINTLPLRINFNTNNKVIDILNIISDELRDKDRNELVPFVEIDRLMKGNTDVEIFNSILNIQNYPINLKEDVSGNLVIKDFYMDEATNYDISICLRVMTKMELYVAYNNELFLETTIESIFELFLSIIEEICDDCNKCVLDLGVNNDNIFDLMNDFNGAF
ncbi:hypothetical protein DVW12_16395 [Clostridium botulinum]|nr:hypothetical protein [Clostridium botulinum]